MPICQPGFCDQWPLQRKSTLARTDKFSEKTFRNWICFEFYIKVFIFGNSALHVVIFWLVQCASEVGWSWWVCGHCERECTLAGCGLMACCTLAVAMLAMLAWFNPKIPEFKANDVGLQLLHVYSIIWIMGEQGEYNVKSWRASPY